MELECAQPAKTGGSRHMIDDVIACGAQEKGNAVKRDRGIDLGIFV